MSALKGSPSGERKTKRYLRPLLAADTIRRGRYFGGVMCALPALAQNGLFRHRDTCFTSRGGYYTTLQVMTLLGYMALCRIKTVEQLQYQPPGELGKLLGLDRVPEVRLGSRIRDGKEAPCERLAPGRKRLLDAVRMMAYRAETAMVGILCEELSRADGARSLVRDLFGRAADILPDPSSGTLRGQVHASANPRLDRAIGHLLEHLTAAEQTYPGTTLKLTCALVGVP